MNYINGSNFTKQIYKAIRKPKNHKFIRQVHTTKCFKGKMLNSGGDNTYKDIHKEKKPSIEINHINQSKYNNNTALKLQATTPKQTEEKYEQKKEKIKDIPVVPQVQNKTSIAGFNNPPKILNTTANWKFYNFIEAKSNYYFPNTYYDDIARRCINSHTDDIDECILKEIKKFGPEHATSDDRYSSDVGKSRHYYVKWSPKKIDVINENFRRRKIYDNDLISGQVTNLHKNAQKSYVVEHGKYDSNTVYSRDYTVPVKTMNQPSELNDNINPAIHAKKRKPEVFPTEISSNIKNNLNSESSANEMNIYPNTCNIKLLEEHVKNTIKYDEPAKSLNHQITFNYRGNMTHDLNATLAKPLYQMEEVEKKKSLKSGTELLDAKLITSKSATAKFLNHVQGKETEVSSTEDSFSSKVTNVSTKTDNIKQKSEVIKNNIENQIPIFKLKLLDAKDGISKSSYPSLSSNAIPDIKTREFVQEHPKTAKSRSHMVPMKAVKANVDTINSDSAKCLNHIQVKINSEEHEGHSLNKNKTHTALSKNLNKPVEISSSVTRAYQDTETKPEVCVIKYSYLSTNLNKPYFETPIEKTTAYPKTEKIPQKESMEANIQSKHIISNVIVTPELKDNDNVPKIGPASKKQGKEMSLSEMLIKVRGRNQSPCSPDPCNKGKPKPSPKPCTNSPSKNPRPLRSKPKPALNPCAPNKRGGCARFLSMFPEAFSN